MREEPEMTTEGQARLARQVTVEEFVEVTFTAILRAIDARPGLPRGPIIYGIVYDPERRLGEDERA